MSACFAGQNGRGGAMRRQDQTEVVTLFPFDGITALRATPHYDYFNDGRSGGTGKHQCTSIALGLG